MAKAKATATDTRAGEWKKNGNAPPPTTGGAREPFPEWHAATCPECLTWLGVYPTKREADAHAKRALGDSHSREYCERVKSGAPAPRAQEVHTEKGPSPKPARRKRAARKR